MVLLYTIYKRLFKVKDGVDFHLMSFITIIVNNNAHYYHNSFIITDYLALENEGLESIIVLIMHVLKIFLSIINTLH